MRKLNDADIVKNYLYATMGTLDRGEELKCARCGKRWTEPGVHAFAWTRIPNQATNLPAFADLCEKCHSHILEVKSVVEP